uniref:Uncharacterized protein n=1 Tax=Eutreptiella gymnastica TaxID=73025 RepID=A0A7S4GAL8_9EUGL
MSPTGQWYIHVDLLIKIQDVHVEPANNNNNNNNNNNGAHHQGDHQKLVPGQTSKVDVLCLHDACACLSKFDVQRRYGSLWEGVGTVFGHCSLGRMTKSGVHFSSQVRLSLLVNSPFILYFIFLFSMCLCCAFTIFVPHFPCFPIVLYDYVLFPICSPSPSEATPKAAP